MGNLKTDHHIFLSSELRKLPLFDVDSRLRHYKKKIRQELRDKGVAFDFHLWVSEEWFCPDGVPGFALPFYLFNEDLMEIQKDQLGFVDGRNDNEILKLMRHELGHAIDNAYGLRANLERQRLFGSSREKYPHNYQPKPYSKNYIHYLGDHYAQSHPDEDFAETFAYWLDPDKKNTSYNLSPLVREKLDLMNRMIREIRHRKPRLKNRFRVEPIEKNKTLLSVYYRKLKGERRYSVIRRLDHDLQSTFLLKAQSLSSYSLAQYLKSTKEALSQEISKSEGVYKYEARWGVEKIIARAERLEIKAPLHELENKSRSLLKRNFRYLKDKDQLKIHL